MMDKINKCQEFLGHLRTQLAKGRFSESDIQVDLDFEYLAAPPMNHPSEPVSLDLWWASLYIDAANNPAAINKFWIAWFSDAAEVPLDAAHDWYWWAIGGYKCTGTTKRGTPCKCDMDPTKPRGGGYRRTVNELFEYKKGVTDRCDLHR